MLESLNLTKMITVAVNLLILYAALRKFLFKPITTFMEKRSNAIRDSIDHAEKAKADALELKQQYEDQLAAARKEAAQIIEEARGKAAREYERIIGAAKKEAEGILIRAREEITRERADMLREARNQIASLALAAASKVMEANMNNESNRALVDRFIEEEGAA
jgi:F-type H+-transporting ATPase subunit b